MTSTTVLIVYSVFAFIQIINRYFDNSVKKSSVGNHGVWFNKA